MAVEIKDWNAGSSDIQRFLVDSAQDYHDYYLGLEARVGSNNLSPEDRQCVDLARRYERIGLVKPIQVD